MLETIKGWASSLKHKLYALYIASHRDDVPMITKIIALIVVAYALSPIDLIPDFIPLLGYLDDIILLPLGILMAIKLMPKEIWEECKEQAKNETLKSLPRSKIAAIFVLLIWAALTFLLIKAFT